MKKSAPLGDKTPAQAIDERIAELGGWRGETLARLRALIRAADPEVVEEWKWNVPVWSRGGIICTGETYKAAVKLTFAKGRRWPIRPGCSTPAWRGIRGGRSISAKGTKWTRRPSRR